MTNTLPPSTPNPALAGVDSPYAWFRLAVSLLLMTVGNGAMWVIPVVLPVVQKDFGVGRAEAALPYTLMMLGFGLGGIIMGRLADRFGLFVPLVLAAFATGSGFMLAGMSTGILGFALAHGLLIGLLGSSVTFAPLMADTALWFARRRGIAVAVCASGNYLAGTIWPPIVQHFVETAGWRSTYLGVGVVCCLSMLLLAPLMRRRSPLQPSAMVKPGARLNAERPFGLSPHTATLALCLAGVACCVAMAMPQVHIVAYCTDLGYGAARGAEMLSLMLACGIVSRLVSLYLIAALFGLFQGGIVPAYAIIVREYFPASQTGVRVGTVIMFTMVGMALGGWMSGKVFDLTGSYHAAFLNGVAWNLLNLTIVVLLLRRTMRA